MFMPVHIHTCACTRACIPVCVLVSCANTCTWMPVRVCLYVHAPWLDPDRRRKRPLRPRAPAGCGWEKPWLTVGAHSLYIAEYRTHAAISMSFLLPGQGEGRESSPPKNTTGNASHARPQARLTLCGALQRSHFPARHCSFCLLLGLEPFHPLSTVERLDLALECCSGPTGSWLSNSCCWPPHTQVWV